MEIFNRARLENCCDWTFVVVAMKPVSTFITISTDSILIEFINPLAFMHSAYLSVFTEFGVFIRGMSHNYESCSPGVCARVQNVCDYFFVGAC